MGGTPVVFHESADVCETVPMIKARFVIDPAALQMVMGVLTGWLDRRERETIAYLIEEKRLLRRQLGTRSCDSDSGMMPRMLARPCVAFSPTTPQNAAGIRIEPAVSVPSAAAHRRAATAAAEPPDDPPGM